MPVLQHKRLKVKEAQQMPIAKVLREFVREGELYRRIEDDKSQVAKEAGVPEKLFANRVECFACGHRCIIFDGLPGVCRVRFNEGGKLYVPWGYVGALNVDPIEKKPFFHAYPGARALSFGMLGCDLQCPYCLTYDARVATEQGMKRIGELFDTTPIRIDLPDGASVAYPNGLSVYTHLGRPRPVRAIFRHPYQGQLLTIVPLLCPPITCTPEHEFLAIPKPKKGQPIPKPTFLPAAKLTREHCLAIPKRYTFSRDITLEVPQWLQTVVKPLSARKSDVRLRRRVMALTEKGWTSRQIGERLGKDASFIRHIRSKVRRGIWQTKPTYQRPAQLVEEGAWVRLPYERRPGLPKTLQLDTRFAALLGYYCAEGCVVRDEHRPNAATLIFSFGHHERNLAERVCQWLRELFGVNPSIVKMPTTLQVAVNKSSLALLFEALCGAKSREKRIPPFLFEAKRDIVDAFVQAYAQGDGTVRPDGRIVVSTVSAELAYGLAWLLLKLGYLPSLRAYRQTTHSTVLGRPVRQAPNIFMVIWRNDNHWRFVWQDDDYYYVPIRQIVSQPFKGFVYNMQVDDEHTYLAQFVATHNCQNWQISQVMRDSVATMLADFTPITPEEFVKMALRYKAKVLTSTYNEPLITSEWAVALFREGKKFGLVGSYVSNGNATPEVLDYIRPFVDLYKIDLKSMQDKNYRELGGKLETVLNTIRWAWERGFWVEVVTLVVPKFNDSEEELRDAARYIASVSPDIPWHVTAFHPDYLMTDRGATPVKTLIRAAEIGYEEGLKFVYAGNLPGMVGPYENTYCPNCHALLIERYGFQVRRYRIVDGKCPDCGEPIPGVWWKEEEVPHYLRR